VQAPPGWTFGVHVDCPDPDGSGLQELPAGQSSRTFAKSHGSPIASAVVHEPAQQASWHGSGTAHAPVAHWVFEMHGRAKPSVPLKTFAQLGPSAFRAAALHDTIAMALMHRPASAGSYRVLPAATSAISWPRSRLNAALHAASSG